MIRSALFLVWVVFVAGSAQAQMSIKDVGVPTTGTLTDALLMLFEFGSDSQVAIDAYDQWIGPRADLIPREVERLIRAQPWTARQKFNVYSAIVGVLARNGNRGFGKMALHIIELRPIMRDLAQRFRTMELSERRTRLLEFERRPVVE